MCVFLNSQEVITRKGEGGFKTKECLPLPRQTPLGKSRGGVPVGRQDHQKARQNPALGLAAFRGTEALDSAKASLVAKMSRSGSPPSSRMASRENMAPVAMRVEAKKKTHQFQLLF